MHKSTHKRQYHSNIINVNFVKDASVDFSAYKNPYNINNCCQMSFTPSEYNKFDVGWGFVPDPTEELTALPSLTSWLTGGDGMGGKKN